ncbi:MAG: nitrogen fixation protein NifM [Thiocapsa sp.]|jgi:peptidyl-prolyl cis-trans isomerase C|nr:nitrogen fixation protein NifM [Thiocapsa sp.]MCG6897016.1 nitrogen fixation protein NifM [Thiocapsa sp.]MCG6983821.1 nitrogen fixation protein NifM [Thiocapsa sp.]
MSLVTRGRAPRDTDARGEYRYHLLRAAMERFRCDLVALSEHQRSEVESQARRTFDLESLVLSSCEAGDVVIPDERLTAAVHELRRRYPDADAFEEDLSRNGLDEDLLRRALRRELTFDAVMRRVGTYAPPLTEVEERLFYELHRERLSSGERRAARHILITINDDYPENRRDAALARIAGIASALRETPGRFPKLARRHSECPTAMQDGSLGLVSRGQLYPTLDDALFKLHEGRISGVLESRLGFHLLLCERIEPARPVTFEQARAKIRSALERRRVRDAQKEWIASLRRG